MNLTDLTAELESRADQVTPSLGMARIAAVRGRIRARRRRQAGAVALIAAGCAVAIAVVPNLVGVTPHRVAPPAKSTAHLVKPFTFDNDRAGDPLVFSALGKTGQSDLTLRFTPKDTNLSLTDFCYLPNNSADEKKAIWAAATINGQPFLDGSCDDSTATGGNFGTPGDPGAKNRANWAELGVRPGKVSVIRIHLHTKAGQSRTDPSVRLGIALYELSGERITDAGFVIKLDAEAEGHDYRLAAEQTRPAGKAFRRWSLPIPAGQCPCVIMGGSAGVVKPADQQRTVEVVVDGGGDGMDELSDGGGVMDFAMAKPGPHTLHLHTEITSGATLLAYYVRVD